MHENDTLLVTLIFLGAALVVVLAARFLRSSSVLGYLGAGVLLGPHALGLVRGTEELELLAELGIVFLLFAIGLELSMERLRILQRYVFGIGSLQVIVTATALYLLLRAVGIEGDAALVMGGALALSSTAFVLQLLIERGELVARFGRVSFSVLLMQDLAIVPMLALVPILARPHESLALSLGEAFLKAAFAVGMTLLVGRVALRPLYRLIASVRSPELFVAASLLVVLGTAYAMHAAGVSMALGAFLAGLLLSGTEYRHQVEADIRPFRGLLLGLFFMTIGLGIDLGLVVVEWQLVLMATFALISVKALILLILLSAFRLPLPVSLRCALYLSQAGEFGLVLIGMAMEIGIVPGGPGQVALATAVCSMAVTPGLVWLSNSAARRLSQPEEQPAQASDLSVEDLRNHVIVAGFGRVGRTVAHLLAVDGRKFVALDMDAARVRNLRAEGLPVYYGDASRLEVLRATGIERAAAAVVTLDRPEQAEAAIEAIRSVAPELPLAVRARDLDHAQALSKVGDTVIVPETVEASLQLGSAVLEAVGASRDDIDLHLGEFRAGGYRALIADEEKKSER